MKVKSLLVFASAAALPFASAFARNNAEPGGPQGTAWYGNPAPFAAYDLNRNGIISADEYPVRAPAYGTPSAGATVAPSQDASTNREVIVRDDRRVSSRDERRARYPYHGHSADTTPPVPPQ